jgi:hypothetical protein
LNRSAKGTIAIPAGNTGQLLPFNLWLKGGHCSLEIGQVSKGYHWYQSSREHKATSALFLPKALNKVHEHQCGNERMKINEKNMTTMRSGNQVKQSLTF